MALKLDVKSFRKGLSMSLPKSLINYRKITKSKSELLSDEWTTLGLDLENGIPPGDQDQDDPDSLRIGTPITIIITRTCRYDLSSSATPIGKDSEGCDVYRVDRICDDVHKTYIGHGENLLLISIEEVERADLSARFVSVCNIGSVVDLGLWYDISRTTPPKWRPGEPYFWIPPTIVVGVLQAHVDYPRENVYLRIESVLIFKGNVSVVGCEVCADYVLGTRTQHYRISDGARLGAPREEPIPYHATSRHCIRIPGCSKDGKQLVGYEKKATQRKI